MGASADQIDRQIRETRDRMDQNLNTLEDRASRNAVRYGKIVAVVAGVAVAGGVAFVLYRRFRRPRTWRDRLRDMSPDTLRELADELGSRLKDARNAMPTVTLTVNDRSDSASDPGFAQSILRRVAPAILGTASTALIERATGTGASSEMDSGADA